ncbi:MAG: sodium-dependent transporter [Eubacteriales bacterium]|nr:sodium-dependent transporter [Eubacteriales bacterium]
MEREKLGSRLGFILISAGCAIGLGNVWRFPYITGQYGGGLFVLIYLVFLLILGVPILTMEYSVGRASHKSILPAYRTLEPEGTKWHVTGYFAMAGNYVLLMFYSVISGWILYYTWLTAKGEFTGMDAEGVHKVFTGMMSSPKIMIIAMLIVVAMTAAVCSFSLQKSVENVTKVIMTALIVLMVIVAIRSLTLKGASEGLKFYLMPSTKHIKEQGLFTVAYAALNQSFFTLSIGMGGMEIFGSYIDRDRSLTGEAMLVTALDTFVAITAGLIIFPSCFAYGIDPGQGPSLIFETLSLVFGHMAGGRVWGTIFFLFLFFASFSTMIGVFENLQAFAIDLKGAKRKTAGIINGLFLAVMSIPCALGFNVWSAFQPLRAGNTIMDLEDFYVSNICLPVGSFIVILFCTRKLGWGIDNYMNEVNAGSGIKMAKGLKFYLTWILPLITGFLVVYGIVTYFHG